MSREPSSEPSSAVVALRKMIAADVPLAMELKNIAGWNQTERDWLGYLTYEPEGCFVAEVGGRAIGTATSIHYDDRFGWIGMVLVHPDARRLGIGTKLLRHTIEYLQQRGTSCVKLDATAMGRKVYVPMGFVDEYELSRFEGTAPAESTAAVTNVASLTTGDLKEVIEFDAPVFGAERAHVIDSMSRRNPEYCFLARDGSRIRGYLIAREGRNAAQIGPWVAQDGATAERLLAAFFQRVRGRRVFVDVPHPNDAGCTLIRSYGFTVQRGFARMHLGENRHPGIPAHVFGTSSAEKG
jgi:ribosomal protein S18 acetylase RimI-like enzyme